MEGTILIKVKHTRNAIFVWEDEKNRGIAYPATVSTELGLFAYEVKQIVLEQMKHIRFMSLVFEPSYGRYYLPMREFLNAEEPHCKNCTDGEEIEMYDFLQYEDNSAKELYNFFFEHSTPTEYKNGYVDYEFKIDQ